MRIGFASMDWAGLTDDRYIPVLHDNYPVFGGSGYIRIGQFFPYLEAFGVEAAIGIPLFDVATGRLGINEWPGRSDFDFDVIFMQRCMHTRNIDGVISAKKAGQIIINDLDDWYWNLGNNHITSKAVDPVLSPDRNINIYKKVLELSDGVIVSTPFLFDRVSEWNKCVKLNMNHVDTAAYSREIKFEKKPKILIGWTGSIPFRAGADVEILKPYSSEISRFATWHHIGGSIEDLHRKPQNSFATRAGLEQGNVRISPIVPPTVLPSILDFDVGIVPLEDVPFNHAKSFIKGLEYAAAGIPFVASWSPQYQLLKEKYDIGIVIDHPSKYVDELRKFVDVDYRREQSHNNLTLVKKHFDVIDGAQKLVKSIKEIADKTARERRRYETISSKKTVVKKQGAVSSTSQV